MGRSVVARTSAAWRTCAATSAAADAAAARRFVIFVLVLAVAAGFWYLATHRGSDGDAATTGDGQARAPRRKAAAKPGAAHAPTELPNPAAIGETGKPASGAHKAAGAAKPATGEANGRRTKGAADKGATDKAATAPRP